MKCFVLSQSIFHVSAAVVSRGHLFVLGVGKHPGGACTLRGKDETQPISVARALGVQIHNRWPTVAGLFSVSARSTRIIENCFCCPNYGIGFALRTSSVYAMEWTPYQRVVLHVHQPWVCSSVACMHITHDGTPLAQQQDHVH